MQKIFNYINGNLVNSKENKWLENYNPAIGEVYSLIPDSDNQDVKSAYIAAQEAFPLWSNKTIKERSEILQKIANLITKKIDELSFAEIEKSIKEKNVFVKKQKKVIHPSVCF